MTLLLSFTIASLFGAGVYLMLKRDLIRVVAGATVLANGTNLFLMGSALNRGQAPIFPLDQSAAVSDPLVQALTLTAIVISLGAAAILLSIVYRVYITHGAIDQLTLGTAERTEEERTDEAKRAERERAYEALR